MSSIDAPDYQTILHLQTTGAPTDAPDWEHVATGPGGTPPVTVTGASPYSVYAAMGLFGLTLDPMANTSTLGPTLGAVNFCAFTAMATGTAGHMYIYVTSGHAVTADENFLCLYDWGETTSATFTLLGNTTAGNIDAALAAGGLVTGALASGVALTAGNVYAMALIVNGSGAPSFVAGNANNAIPLNPFGTTYPVATTSTAAGHTTPPGSLAFTSTTTARQPYYMLVGP
jgi:hypothetical protein